MKHASCFHNKQNRKTVTIIIDILLLAPILQHHRARPRNRGGYDGFGSPGPLGSSPVIWVPSRGKPQSVAGGLAGERRLSSIVAHDTGPLHMRWQWWRCAYCWCGCGCWWGWGWRRWGWTRFSGGRSHAGPRLPVPLILTDDAGAFTVIIVEPHTGLRSSGSQAGGRQATL
jgi:hypothetical protein